MIYQETTLPIWADILIIIVVPIVIFLLLTYEPPAKKEEKQVQEVKTDKELNKIADLIKARATFAELEEFKHLERREDRKAWVENQIAKLDKGEVLP